MKRPSPADDAIKSIRNLTNQLTPEELEQFRDELLAFLLFSQPVKGNSDQQLYGKGNMPGLSEQERDLIRKLARNTEHLNRLMNGEDAGENTDEDQ